MGPRAGLDRCGKSRLPTEIRSQDRPARSVVGIPTTVPGPLDTTSKGKVHPCTGTEALYRAYGP